MKSAKMSGLRRKQTYDEMINYLHYGQEVVKYPDRKAKQLRESPCMTQLDGEDLDQQHERLLNQQKRQLITQQVSAQTGRSQAEQNIQRPAQEIGRNPRAPPPAFPPNLYEHFDDAEEGGPPDDPTMRQETGNMVEVPVRNARAVQDQWNVRAEEAMVNSNTWRVQDTARVAQVVGKFGMWGGQLADLGTKAHWSCSRRSFKRSL
jgi:hypothetical protein